MIGNPLQVTDPATEKARRARLQQSASRGQLVHLAQLSGNSSDAGLAWWNNRVPSAMEGSLSMQRLTKARIQ